MNVPRLCSKLSLGSQNDFERFQPKQKERLKVTNLIPQPELLFGELHAPAQTLSDTEPLLIELSRELKADATKAGVFFGVYT